MTQYTFQRIDLNLKDIGAFKCPKGHLIKPLMVTCHNGDTIKIVGLTNGNYMRSLGFWRCDECREQYAG